MSTPATLQAAQTALAQLREENAALRRELDQATLRANFLETAMLCQLADKAPGALTRQDMARFAGQLFRPVESPELRSLFLTLWDQASPSRLYDKAKWEAIRDLLGDFGLRV